MNERTDPAPPSAPPSAVADEMAAIFGPGQRVAPPRPAPAPPRPVRRGGVRAPVAVLLLGALGASIAGGVMLGRDAVGPTAPTPGVSAATPRSAAPAHTPFAAPVEAQRAPVALPPVAQVSTIRPDELPQVASVDAPTPTRSAPPPRVAAIAPPATAPRAAPATYTRADPPRAERTRCFGERDCLNVRLYETDGEVARAYAAATSAGVRARTLREYRSEWLRARDLAERRPREALRIYGMIAADLFDLAEDAAADERMPRS